MFPLLGSLVTGGLGLLGNLFSSNTSAENNERNVQAQMATNQQQMAFNAEQAGLNRDFTHQEAQNQMNYQSVMSNSAYQRAAMDMKAAGLNPMMMFGSGQAASAPSGAAGGGSQASASLQAPKTENPGAVWSNLGALADRAVSSAVQVKTMDKMSDEMANLQAENSRIKALTKNVVTNTAKSAQETKTEVERTRGASHEADTAKERTDTQKLENVQRKLDRARQEFEAIKYIDLSTMPDVYRRAGNIGSWAGGKVLDTISPLVSGARGARTFQQLWNNRGPTGN